MTWDTPTVRVQTTAAADAGGQTHTIGSGDDRCIWVYAWNGGSGFTVSGTPTFAGNNLSLLSGMPFNGDPVFANFYGYRLISPPVGSGALVMNFSASTTVTILVISAAGVDQITPNDAVDTDTSADPGGDSTATTASEVGDEVVDILFTGGISAGGNFIPGAGQTVLANVYNSAEGHALASSRKAGAVSVTQTWDIFTAIGDVASFHHFQMNVNAAPVVSSSPVGRFVQGAIPFQQRFSRR